MIKKFYFPLTVGVRARGDYDWSDDCIEYDGTFAYDYKDVIENALGYEDMLEYMWDDDGPKEKIKSMYWGFEDYNRCLYGKVDVELHDQLTTEEVEQIKNYICGQNSDGLGEGFEQQEIRIGYDEEMYVHFWEQGEKYWIYDEDEFNNKIKNKMSIRQN